MNGYEKLIKTIIQLIDKKTTSTVYLTTMKTPKTCKINDLLLDEDDLLIADHLIDLKAEDMVLIVKVNDEKFAILERLVSL